jgi:hypothetical protein
MAFWEVGGTVFRFVVMPSRVRPSRGAGSLGFATLGMVPQERLVEVVVFEVNTGPTPPAVLLSCVTAPVVRSTQNS